MDLKDIQKPKLYNMHEVAKAIGVSYITLYRLVKSGKIQALNIAKSGKRPIFAFSAHDVKRYIDSLSSPSQILPQEE